MDFEGKWQHKDGQGSVTATLEIAAGQQAEGGWRVSAKVGNRMNCQLREEGGRLKAGPVISTRMMPPPELRELENNVSDILGNLTDIQRNGNILKMCAGEKSLEFELA